MIGAALSAVVLMLLIKFILDEDTSFGSAFVASLIASIVAAILSVVACAPIESAVATLVIETVIRFVVTAIVVQILCSTDLRGLLLVAGIYTGLILFFQIALVMLVLLAWFY